MWRPVVLTLAGLAGYAVLVLLAWLDDQAARAEARQSERERQRGQAAAGGHLGTGQRVR
jgi:ABC-type protease/lipase transport system fused ATPase/permease subunit